MISITDGSIREDRYIAHLAGQQNGKKIIGFNDKYNALSAQNHPISNRIAAEILGSVRGGVATTLGLLAYPLMNSSVRSSIFGSSWSVCSACGPSVKTLAELVTNVKEIIGRGEASSFLSQKFNSYGMGIAATSVCATDNEALMKCRQANYGAEIWNTVSNNYMLIGAIHVGLAAAFAYSQMNTYTKRELQAEAEIKTTLIERFEKIATRLKDLEQNQEIQGCVHNILHRQLEINKELESLQLPNLSWKEIKQITQPVFDVAKAIQEKNQLEITSKQL